MGFNSSIDFYVQMNTFGLVELNMSEDHQVLGTKAAVVAVIGATGYNAGLLSGGEIAGISGLSGYQAFGQEGNWLDNTLSNMGGNLTLGIAGSYLIGNLSNPLYRDIAAYAGAASLAKNIIDATINIDKKYGLR